LQARENAAGSEKPTRWAASLIETLSAALAIAAGSFFLGQPRFVPEPIRDTAFAALPMLTTLALMVYWLLRTKLGARNSRARRKVATAAA
jgi:hypothetical protein